MTHLLPSNSINMELPKKHWLALQIYLHLILSIWIAMPFYSRFLFFFLLNICTYFGADLNLHAFVTIVNVGEWEEQYEFVFSFIWVTLTLAPTHHPTHSSRLQLHLVTLQVWLVSLVNFSRFSHNDRSLGYAYYDHKAVPYPVSARFLIFQCLLELVTLPAAGLSINRLYCTWIWNFIAYRICQSNTIHVIT